MPWPRYVPFGYAQHKKPIFPRLTKKILIRIVVVMVVVFIVAIMVALDGFLLP